LDGKLVEIVKHYETRIDAEIEAEVRR